VYSGFRYVAVYGVDDGAQISDVTCYFIHSACALIGNFSTSSAVMNQVQHNVQWSILSNIASSVPTDCPSRDERRGYGGDGALGVDAALYNFDLALFYDSWLYQWRVAQWPNGMVPLIAPGRTDSQTDPNWGTVMATVVSSLYNHYGDLGMVSRHYPVVHDWVEFSRAQYNQTGLKGFFGFVGDWVPPPPFGQSNMQLISAFSFLRDLDTLVTMAQLLNYTADYARYSALYASLAAEWHRTWYNDGIKGYADGMQAANVMSLYLPRVVPDALRADVVNSLVKDVQQRGQFTTGMVSFARLFPVLSDSGHHDLALELVQQTTYPSFGYEVSCDTLRSHCSRALLPSSLTASYLAACLSMPPL
jgi:alpha-L-rhamnosidase